MAQEIIAYIIVAFAVCFAGFKIYNKLAKKKRNKKITVKNELSEVRNSCSDCLAECILRDLTPDVKSKNAQLCERTLENLKCS